jgi:hypothetical protein
MPARPDDVLWSKTYGENGNYTCLSVARAPDGGYVFAGQCLAPANASAYAGRTDSNGSLLWHKLYPVKDSSFSVALNTLDGNFLFVGTGRREDGSGQYGGYLLKAGQDGSRLFNKSIGIDSSVCMFQDAVQEVDGSFVILGTIDNRSHRNNTAVGGLYIFVLKTDANGNPLWSRAYGSGNLEGYGIARSPDGGYAIAGFTFMKNSSLSYGYLLRIDGTGNTLWNVSYEHDGDTNFYTLCTAGGDGYLLAGAKHEDNDTKIYLSRVAPNGTGLWNRTFDSTGLAYDVMEASDGGFVLACGSDILKVNEHGDAEWQRNLGGADGFLGSVAEASDGSYVFGGTTRSGSGNHSSWLVDIGNTKSPGITPETCCWPALVLPAVVISVVALKRRRQC